MVVAEVMEKPTLKVSVSDSESSPEESELSDNKEGVEMEAEEACDVSVNAESESNADNESNADIDLSAESGIKTTEEALMKNEGWADSVAKILSSSKPRKKKTLVLSRAKKFSAETHKEIKEEKPSFEVIGESTIQVLENKVTKEEKLSEEPETKKKKYDKSTIRVKPNVLEKDRERLLSKIATKGIVQLFNAVRNQQKSLEKDLDRSDLTETKKEKILKKFDKRAFLDKLMGPTKSIVVDEVTKSVKGEVKRENELPKWSALRDDFMMGAKMKDWDKESVDE